MSPASTERRAATAGLRAAMAAAVLPRLRVGEAVPSCRALGYLFRISHSQAAAHLRAVLAAAGVVVRLDRESGRPRLVVVSLPKGGP